MIGRRCQDCDGCWARLAFVASCAGPGWLGLPVRGCHRALCRVVGEDEVNERSDVGYWYAWQDSPASFVFGVSPDLLQVGIGAGKPEGPGLVGDFSGQPWDAVDVQVHDQDVVATRTLDGDVSLVHDGLPGQAAFLSGADDGLYEATAESMRSSGIRSSLA